MASAEWFFAAKFQNAARFLDKIGNEVKQLGTTKSALAGSSSRRPGGPQLTVPAKLAINPRDPHELGTDQGGAADQRAIDVFDVQ